MESIQKVKWDISQPRQWETSPKQNPHHIRNLPPAEISSQQKSRQSKDLAKTETSSQQKRRQSRNLDRAETLSKQKNLAKTETSPK